MSDSPPAFGSHLAAHLHELNQPLTAILSNAQAGQRFLADKAFDVAELRSILADIVVENKRAANIVRRLTDAVKEGRLPGMSVYNPGVYK